MVTQPRRSAFIVIFKLFVGLRNPIRPSERSTFIWHDLINPRIDLYKMAFYSSSSSSVSRFDASDCGLVLNDSK